MHWPTLSMQNTKCFHTWLSVAGDHCFLANCIVPNIQQQQWQLHAVMWHECHFGEMELVALSSQSDTFSMKSLCKRHTDPICLNHFSSFLFQRHINCKHAIHAQNSHYTHTHVCECTWARKWLNQTAHKCSSATKTIGIHSLNLDLDNNSVLNKLSENQGVSITMLPSKLWTSIKQM